MFGSMRVERVDRWECVWVGLWEECVLATGREMCPPPSPEGDHFQEVRISDHPMSLFFSGQKSYFFNRPCIFSNSMIFFFHNSLFKLLLNTTYIMRKGYKNNARI